MLVQTRTLEPMFTFQAFDSEATPALHWALPGAPSERECSQSSLLGLRAGDQGSCHSAAQGKHSPVLRLAAAQLVFSQASRLGSLAISWVQIALDLPLTRVLGRVREREDERGQ